MSQIPLPSLPPEQVAEIRALYAQGETLKTISAKTGVKYSFVYFYTVQGGIVAPGALGPRITGECWCGKRHYAKGLCSRHYWQMYDKIRRPKSKIQ